MKVLKTILTVSVISFGIFGLFGVLEYDISQPIIFTCLSIVYLITAKEYSNKGEKIPAIYFLIGSIFIFVVIIAISVWKYCL